MTLTDQGRQVVEALIVTFVTEKLYKKMVNKLSYLILCIYHHKHGSKDISISDLL